MTKLYLEPIEKFK